MRVVYVYNHAAGGNDDEGAIAYALEQLGHDVVRVPEERGRAAVRLSGDLLLFHKFDDVDTLHYLKGRMRRAYWYFDLVDYPDPTLAARCRARRDWMARITPHVDVGFCTDGDHVAADPTGKLVWLPQGADERVVGRGTPGTETDILFTGTAKGGQQRESFVTEMKERYGDRFRHVPAGVHGKELRDLIAGAKIVVAPDGPVTSRYASNRIFITLGFGGFLLHPWCEAMTDLCPHGEGVVYYSDRADLHAKIRHYLGPLAVARKCIADTGLETTLSRNLYRHRVAELIRVVQERLP